MINVLPSVLPILLLISMGYYMQRKETIKQSTIDEIKRIVLNIALPSLLFLNFKDMELKIEYLTLTITVFLFFCVLYLIAEGLNKIKGFYSPLLPFLLPGFALGTLGIPLYVSVFGVENLSKYIILAIGHELFVWFILIVIIKMKHSGTGFSFKIIIDFIRNPFIIAITLGITLNITGLGIVFDENAILKGIGQFLEYLSTIVTPLILIVIGYGLKLNKQYIRESIKLLMIRIPLILIIGYIVKFVFLDRIIIGDRFFDYAWFTYLILPPTYAITLLIGDYSTKENADIASNVAVLGTIISIIIYIIFVLVISI